MNQRLGLVLLSAMVVSTGSAQSLNLWLEPATQSAVIGQTVTIDVYANSTGPGILDLSDAYLAIGWDPAVLTNATPSVVAEPAPWDTSYWAPGSSLNTNLQDGDARRELLGDFAPNHPIAPQGVMRDAVNRIKVTSFLFTVDVATPSTSVKLWNSLGGETTNFLKGNFQIGQWDLVFEDGAYSEAVITVVPEPATLAVTGLGLAAMLRRRRRA